MWYEQIIELFDKNYEVYYLLLLATGSSFQPMLYHQQNGEIEYDGQFVTLGLFEKYRSEQDGYMEKPGIYVYEYRNGKYIGEHYIKYYNIELFPSELSELVLFQLFGVRPEKEERKEELEKSIKAEKIKKTLVYACYSNDMERIKELVKSAKPAALNKKFNYSTPLGFCAVNNNFEGFCLIAEAGGDISKSSRSRKPLELAFDYSPEIVMYIYENYREEFDKIVHKKGFNVAARCQSVEILKLLKDYGFDMVCEGQQYPPLHDFADNDNVVGLQFLIELGISLDLKNQYGQTALDRAIRHGRKNARAYLEKCMGIS